MQYNSHEQSPAQLLYTALFYIIGKIILKSLTFLLRFCRWRYILDLRWEKIEVYFGKRSGKIMGFVREECSKLLRTRSRSRCFYHEYYKCFDIMPIAFADIEMIFDEERQAIDWIFRYGNEALAIIEGVSLEKMIGRTFRSIFPNMDRSRRCFTAKRWRLWITAPKSTSICG